MPAVLEPPPVRRSTNYRQRMRRHRIARAVVRLVILGVVAGTVGGGYYLARRGFGREWRYVVVEELHKRGVEASIGRLTLDPFRGLVARSVRIFDYKNRENTLALINEVSLDINYAALFNSEPFLNALDVRDAQITLPLRTAAGKGEKVRLTNFRAHIYFPPEQIYVSQAEGIFCGIRISATGQLIKRNDYQPSPAISAEEWQRRVSTAERVVNELQKFNYPAELPSLQLKFSGDIAEMEKAHVEATLRGERLQRGSYEIRALSATAEWNRQHLDISHFEWSDTKGSFAARADWNQDTNNVNFQLRSSVDLKNFLDACGLGEPLAGIEFQARPLVEIYGSLNLQADRFRPDVIGHAVFGEFRYKNVPFSDLAADFSWDGERTFVRNLRVRHQTGQVRADLLDAPGDFRLNIESTISPAAIRGLLPQESSEFVRQWEWQQPPAIRLAIRGGNRNPESWQGDGTISLGRSRFRGAWMNNANANIRFADGALTCEDVHVTRDEGAGAGNFTYDFKKHEVRVSDIKSSLNPAEAIFWIDPKMSKTVALFKFRRPPNIVANGVYQFRGGKNTRLEVKVDGADGMEYVFLGKTLPFDHASGRLLFTRDRLQILDFRGDIFSGTLRGSADISLAQNNPRYHATLTLQDVDFPRLTSLYFSYYHYRSVRGQVSGTYDFDGFGTDARKMNGAGKVAVANGDVFAIPFLGPISEILNHIVPGIGYSIARDADTKFTIKNGIIHTDDFNVAGQLFSVIGHGDVYFLDDKIDLDVRISAKGPGIVLTPVYKLFEYKAEGSLKKPNWHPKIF